MSSQTSPGEKTNHQDVRKPLNLHRIREMAANGEKLAMLTCYDASFAKLMDTAGLDILLIGDSLGMVIQGQTTTLPVSMESTLYHVKSVVAGNRCAWVVGDMPFGSYQESIEQAVHNAIRIMQAGAQMVKLEGGEWTVPVVQALTERGIPVCAHLGLTPQSVHALGGYRIQGKDEDAAEHMVQQALALAKAGAALMVLELIPSALAKRITEAVAVQHCLTIGIGAGGACSGQVLVNYDMLGLTQGRLPRFVRNFMDGQTSVLAALQSYVSAVKDGSYPDEALHGY